MAPTKEEALAAVGKYLGKGQGFEGSKESYSETADKYDEFVTTLNYSAPNQLYKSMTSLLGDRRDVRIMDIGAGTGLSGQAIKDAGFQDIDGLDAVQGLLDVAKQKQIYKNLICHAIGDEKMPIASGTYDVVTICGSMGENHIPKTGLRDIIRIVKSGGYIVNVFREEAMRVAWYGEGLEPFMKELETEGLWQEKSRELFPHFLTKDVQGIALVHKVL